MAQFGSVLRNLGSVLNPQVERELAAQEHQEQGFANQLGMLGIQRQFQLQDQDRQQRLTEASPEYQAKLEALKNEKLFRDEAASAGGDMTKIAGAAVKYGKPDLAVNIFNQQEQRAARLQQSREALEARKQELETRMADKSLDRESRERMAGMMADLKAQGLRLQAENAEVSQRLKLLDLEMKGERVKADNLRLRDKSVKELGVALEKAGLPITDQVMTHVEKTLHIGKDEKKAKELASYISGENAWKPDLTSDQEVRDARQAVHKLFNITLKDRSGAAVTLQELERLKQEFATGIWKRPEQLINGIKKAREIINQHYTSVAAGYGKDALDGYNENIKALGGRPVLGGSNVLKFDKDGNPIQ